MKPMPSTPTLDELIREAHERWEHGDLKGLSREQFWSRLDPLQRDAVILAAFNYQTFNGGFAQWIGNGYDSGSIYLTSALAALPDTPEVIEVRATAEKVIGIAARYRELEQTATYEDDPGWDEIDRIMEPLDPLAFRYYELAPAFLQQLEDSLRERRA